MTKPKKRRAVSEYEDENTYEWRECRELERNGSLTYVEDIETGERRWKDRWEVR
jgi:hypothetical protein